MDEERERELEKLEKPPQMEDVFWEQYKKDVFPKAFEISITAEGEDNEVYAGYGDEILSSSNLPESIVKVSISNETAYTSILNKRPNNRFSIVFDFSNSFSVNPNVSPSASTPNQSIISIQGERSTWVSVIQYTVESVIKHKKNNNKVIHRSYVYDLGLWIFAFPAALYLCYRVSYLYKEFFESVNSFIAVGIYIYAFMVCTIIYRLLFEYAKWLFPLVELKKENKMTVHRRLLGAIIVSIIGTFVYDIFLD